MKRVLRIINRPAIGGPILNAGYLSRYLSPEFETLLVAGRCESHETSAISFLESMGIAVQHMDSMGRSLNPLNDWKSLLELRRLIRVFKPDIIHTHAAKPGALGRLAGYLEKVPVIVHTYHGHVFHSYFNPLKTRVFLEIEKQLARVSDTLIAISPEQKTELSETFQIAGPEKFQVIPLGFDLDRFQTDREAKRKAFRSGYGIQADDLVVVITGRLVGIKNHSLFLRALASAKKQTGGRLIGFVVGDGEMRATIEQEALDLGFKFSGKDSREHGEDLVFTSWRTDIDTINAGADIVVLTSLNEGTPVSLIEASASGCPVISTRVGGVESVVLNDLTGYLVESNDSGALTDKMIRLAANPDLRTQLGHAGVEHVRSRFAYQRLVSDMAALYNELLEKKR